YLVGISRNIVHCLQCYVTRPNHGHGLPLEERAIADSTVRYAPTLEPLLSWNTQVLRGLPKGKDDCGGIVFFLGSPNLEAQTGTLFDFLHRDYLLVGYIAALNLVRIY